MKKPEVLKTKFVRFLLSKKRFFIYFISSVCGLIFCLLILSLLFPLKDKIHYSTIVTDSRGAVIHAFLANGDKWRMKTELNEVSPQLKKTIIHKEDRRFYRHFGVDIRAIIRAAFSNVFRLKRVSGASTITMQVARLLEPRKRTYASKFIEIFRAFQLEWKYTKDEILLMYLNMLPYGSNVEGVKSASVLYLNKNPFDLSLAEIAALSIIPNKPTSLKIGLNNDHIVDERNRWLRRWQKDGLFGKKEISDALSELFNARRREAPKLAPHLAQKLRQSYKKEIIKTHLVMNTQLKLEKLIKDYVLGLAWMNIRNAACVVIDNKTQKVISYIGSADFFDRTDGGQVNGAAAVRQPGSALKPLLYGLCIDEGIFCPQTVLTDVPININGYQPENYDNTFSGLVTAAYALENSLNIPAVKALNDLGKEKLTDKLTDCRFKQIYKDRKKLGLSMVLGGCGVTLEEMTGLFTVFAHDGKFQPPSYCNFDTSGKKIDVLSPAATFMITEMLAKISRPDMPVGYENSTHLPKIAWKTGTSYGRRDAWSIGYNHNYTIGVWVGNFSNEGIPELSGATIATPLLFKIFNTLDYDSPNEWFYMPADCEVRWVCSETGMLPNHFCTDKRLDYFIPLKSPSDLCEHMQEMAVSPDEKYSYCKSCQPEAGYKKIWYKVVLPEMQSWYEDRNINYPGVPPHNPDCEKLFSENAPQITFPVNGSEYLISKENPEPLQLSCQVAGDVQEVFWYVNNRIFKKSAARSKIFFTPPSGQVKISCTDDKGRNTDISIRVEYVDY